MVKTSVRVATLGHVQVNGQQPDAKASTPTEERETMSSVDGTAGCTSLHFIDLLYEAGLVVRQKDSEQPVLGKGLSPRGKPCARHCENLSIRGGHVYPTLLLPGLRLNEST